MCSFDARSEGQSGHSLPEGVAEAWKDRNGSVIEGGLLSSRNTRSEKTLFGRAMGDHLARPQWRIYKSSVRHDAGRGDHLNGFVCCKEMGEG